MKTFNSDEAMDRMHLPSAKHSDGPQGFYDLCTPCVPAFIYNPYPAPAPSIPLGFLAGKDTLILWVPNPLGSEV